MTSLSRLPLSVMFERKCYVHLGSIQVEKIVHKYDLLLIVFKILLVTFETYLLKL